MRNRCLSPPCGAAVPVEQLTLDNSCTAIYLLSTLNKILIQGWGTCDLLAAVGLRLPSVIGHGAGMMGAGV